MIVKVQQSIISSDGKKSVLIYNKDRSIMNQLEGPNVTEPILKRMGEQLKKYYNAEIGDDGEIILMDEVNTQEW